MFAVGVPLEQLTQSHLTTLLAGAARETRTIEFKRGFPEPTQDGKREFLADVTSFANAAGGDLILGVAEVDGVASSIEPIVGNIDEMKLRWEAVCREGIEPRVPGLRLQEIPVEGGHVVIVRIPRSWAGPHAVARPGGAFRFYSRNSAGKYPLDMSELKAQFLGSGSVRERIDAFRTERLARVVAGATPVMLPDGPRIVVHLVPLDSFATGEQFDLTAVMNGSGLFRPCLGDGPGQERMNIDGVLTSEYPYQDRPPDAYTQIFRNGVVEGVATYWVAPHAEQYIGERCVYAQAVETKLNTRLGNLFVILRSLGVSLPFVVLVSIVGLRDVTVVGDHPGMRRQSGHTIDRDVLLLPDVTIQDESLFDDLRNSVPRALRPIADGWWQASGRLRSPNYDENGEWTVPAEGRR